MTVPLQYAVLCYKVGEPHDGESFGIGPFADADEAERVEAEAAVSGEWQTQTINLFQSEEALRRKLREAA